MRSRVYLGVGSNIGDRLLNLQTAADLLDAHDDLRVLASSRVWETEPVGGPPQPDFLNAVLEVRTDLSPRGLLGVTQGVEAELHRERVVRWGPRTLDIDLLLFDDRTIDEPDLVIPHPRLRERAFVVLPLMELAPGLILPDGRALATSVVAGEARPFAPPLRTSDRT